MAFDRLEATDTADDKRCSLRRARERAIEEDAVVDSMNPLSRNPLADLQHAPDAVRVDDKPVRQRR